MKIIAAILVCLMFSQSFGQKTKVSESEEKIGNGKNNALVVNILEANEDEVAKAWRDKMKDADAKVSGKSDMFADNAVLPLISSNTVDVYAIFEQKDGYVKMAVAFDLGGAFLNSRDHAQAYKEAEKMIYKFAVDMSKAAVQAQIDTQQAAYSKMENSFNSLGKDNERLNRDIEDYTKKIEDAKKKIEENTAEQERTKSEMDAQSKIVEELQKKLNAVD